MPLFPTKVLAPIVMLVAAACEVGGDALIRAGLRARGLGWCAAGAVTLAAYGVTVNLIPMDFSRLLGTYVAFFAVVSVVFGAAFFGETIPAITWIGLGVIVVGSALIQVGALR
jgi:small multidrug resistance family-3 protein